MNTALRASLAAAAGLALGLGGVGTAFAQDEPAEDTASGTPSGAPGLDLNGQLGGEDKPVNAYVNNLVVDDRPYAVYSIQIDAELQQLNTHQERAWEDIPVTDLPLVLGVLANGYSTANGGNAAEVLEAAGVGGQFIPSDEVSIEEVAYAGTQAAIWHLTDGWEIDDEDPTAEDEDIDELVTAVSDYLLDNAEPIDEPNVEPHFEIDDAEAVTDGNRVGPFTVSANFGPVMITQPEGATVVDEFGTEVDRFEEDVPLWVEFDEGQSDPVTVAYETATWIAPVGRTFAPVDESGADVDGQRLILAEQVSNRVAAEAEFALTADETASSSSEEKLPVTGSSLTTVGGIGAAVLGAGIIAVVLMRRRAAADGWGENEQ